MDRITKTLLDEFVAAESLQTLDAAGQFERLANYCVISREFPETFDVETVSTGGGEDGGLDGIAVIVNGVLVSDPTEVDELVATNGYCEALFVFVQAKRTRGFDGSQIGSFLFGVKDFFSENPSLGLSEAVTQAAKLQSTVYSYGAKMTRGKPRCTCYYVTTGKWVGDAKLISRYEAGLSDLEDLGLFEAVDFQPVGANELHQLYQDTKSKMVREFTFDQKVTLPDISGVEVSYLGVLFAKDYLHLITDDAGKIVRSLFYDNVRDFQDYNDVNKGIRKTLRSPDTQRGLPILNNGITVVAKSLKTIGNRFRIEDYQVVNGCQTSHVLYDERDNIDEGVFVPLRLIVTSDEGVASSITSATNSQTSVKGEQLHALSFFQKRLESYFATFSGKERLYYERRSRQYNGIDGIEKVRIVAMTTLLRAFTAMFQNEPHRVSRSYSKLLQSVGTSLFSENHKMEPYYVAAYTQYRLEFLFRNGSIDTSFKPARYQIMMCVRHILEDAPMPALTANRMEQHADQLMRKLWDDTLSNKAFSEARDIIDSTAGGPPTRDVAATASFTQAVLQALR